MSKSALFSFDIFKKSSKPKAEQHIVLGEDKLLSAMPCEYVAWGEKGRVYTSKGLRSLLGIENVIHLADIKQVLRQEDRAVLGELFSALESCQKSFSHAFIAQDHNFLFQGTENRQRVFLISGHVKAWQEEEKLHLLWIEEISEKYWREQKEKEDQLEKQAQKEQLEDALNALPYSAWLRNAEQSLVWCNSAYAKALNIDAKTIISEQKEFIIPPKKKDKKNKVVLGRDLAKEAFENNKPVSSKTHIVTGGKRLLMKVSEIPLKKAGLTMGLAEDITIQEDMEQKLNLHYRANQELLEQLGSAIGIYDSDHSLDFYNSAFASLWGLEEIWLNTKPKLGDIMEKLRETRRLPEQADFRRYKQSWLDMFTSLIDQHEEMIHLPDGSALRMLVVPSPSGGLMMTFEDVTSRLELESSYNTLIAVQKETLDNLAEAVAVYGGDGRLKLWNPAFGRLWDLNPEDLEGEPHVSSVVEKVRALIEKKNWSQEKEEFVALGLDRVMHEGRHELNNGVRLDYSTVPLPDGGVLITYTDVTDTVRVENALREKNKALETAEQLKLDFLANVSYQLRTPLNAIMGFNEILDQEYFGPLNKRQKEYTHDMKLAGDRLLNLINDILDLSSIEAGYLTLNTKPTKIHEMLESLVDLVGDWARKSQIEMTLSCPKNIGSIEIDPQRIRQALINLIRNSISYTPERGEINLRAKKTKEGIEFIVSDTGVGIDKKDQLRILQPFERAHAGMTEKGKDQSGAGLGLSLVHNIVSMHGGHMNLKSEKGKGTTVSFFIPFAHKKPKQEKK